MAAPVGPGTPERDPYKTPRWILWVVGVVSVAAVVAAFLVGPDSKTKKGPATTTAAAPATSATTPSSTTTGATTTAPSTTAPSTATTTRSTTTAPPATTTTAPRTTTVPAPPPPTTAPPTAPPPTAPPPAASATVRITTCRVEGATAIIATGTVTNTGPVPGRFRANVLAVDRAGNPVTGFSADVGPLAPGATAPFTARQDIDPGTASRISNCRAGAATPI